MTKTLVDMLSGSIHVETVCLLRNTQRLKDPILRLMWRWKTTIASRTKEEFYHLKFSLTIE